VKTSQESYRISGNYSRKSFRAIDMSSNIDLKALKLLNRIIEKKVRTKFKKKGSKGTDRLCKVVELSMQCCGKLF